MRPTAFFPASWIKTTLLKASAGSRAGLFYVAASGTKLHNLGEFMLKLITSDGANASIMFQVANTSKPLASVAHLTDLGYCVVFCIGITEGTSPTCCTRRRTIF